MSKTDPPAGVAEVAHRSEDRPREGSTRSAPVRLFGALVVVVLIVLGWSMTREEDGTLWRSYSVQSVMINLVVTYALLSACYLAFGRGEKRYHLFRVILLAFSIGFCLVVLELPAVLMGHNYEATFGNESTSTWFQLSSNINRPDPDLIHLHWPHSQYAGSVVGNLVYFGIAPATLYPFDLRYDKNGFRNDEDLTQADVVVIGDSFIEAALIPTEQTVVKQIEKRLNLTTANLGQYDYGLRQELEVLKRFGRPLQPKLVLWFLFGGNDLRDVENYERDRAHFGQLQTAMPLKYRLFTRNALLALSRLTTPPRTRPSKRALSRSGMFTLADGRQERVYFGQTNDPWNPHEWQVTTETLSEARAICDEIKAKFVLVFISRKFRLYRDFIKVEPDSLVAKWKVNDLPQALADWCATQQIDFVDTIPALRAVLERGENPHLVDDVHWNATGHAVAAEAVVEHLRQEGWPMQQPATSSP